MPPISILIKPASSSCNLNCRYCFYHETAKSRTVRNYGIMAEETAAVIIQKVFNAATESVDFVFQGGEPLLAGYDYFLNFLETAARLNTRAIPVNYSIQTNGTLLNEEWCKLLKNNNFLVGISLDGTEEVHNFLRKNGKTGAFCDVLKKTELLKQFRIPFNILTVVTKQTAKLAEKIYRSYQSYGFGYVQFIPCMEEEGNTVYSLSPQNYENFLGTLYDLWQKDYAKGKAMNIQPFQSFIAKAYGQERCQCNFIGHCSIQFVAESNGNVYPCDFYCNDSHCLGNIYDMSLKELYECDKAQHFIKESFVKAQECKSCPYFSICGGGCKKEQLNGKTKFCRSYHSLFKKMFNLC